MQKLSHILLLLERGCSERTIAKQLDISRPTVHQYATTFTENDIGYAALLTPTVVGIISALLTNLMWSIVS